MLHLVFASRVNRRSPDGPKGFMEYLGDLTGPVIVSSLLQAFFVLQKVHPEAYRSIGDKLV